MFTVLRIIILFVVIAGGLGFILYNIAKFYLALAPNSNRISKEFSKIKSLLSSPRAELIPFTEKDFELLSAQIKEVTESSYTIGTLSTVFSEPLITYGYYNFLGNDRSVLVVETSKHTLEYNFREDHVDIFSNGDKLGFINNDGLQAPTLNIIYKFIEHMDPDYIHVQCNGELIGEVIQATNSHAINSKAIRLQKDHEQYNEELFLAAMIYLILS